MKPEYMPNLTELTIWVLMNYGFTIFLLMVLSWTISKLCALQKDMEARTNYLRRELFRKLDTTDFLRVAGITSQSDDDEDNNEEDKGTGEIE